MKLVIRTLFFHIFCIIIFAFLYYKFREDFTEEQEQEQEKVKISAIDSVLLSTTIQAGVGISKIYPETFYGKIIMIIQQMIMIMTHLITLYIFTI
jgi:hypothetical protein